MSEENFWGAMLKQEFGTSDAMHVYFLVGFPPSKSVFSGLPFLYTFVETADTGVSDLIIMCCVFIE